MDLGSGSTYCPKGTAKSFMKEGSVKTYMKEYERLPNARLPLIACLSGLRLS